MPEEILLKEGDFAPDFTMDADNGKTFTLSEQKGKNVVMYFYPRDNTPGCTQESKDFANKFEDFEDANTIIIGISKDSVESHDKFKAKFDFPFTLGSDQNSTVCEAYDCWVEKNMYGKKSMGILRSTFLIDKHGIIKKIWRKVKVDGHVEEVLEKAESL